MSNKLFIGNISGRTSSGDLRDEFGKYGTILNVTIKDGKNIYAFVKFEDHEQAKTAMNRLNGAEIMGREIRVELSKSKLNGGEHSGYNYRSSGDSQPQDRRCYSCGRRGHIARLCPDRRERYSRSRSPRRKASNSRSPNHRRNSPYRGSRRPVRPGHSSGSD